MQWPKGYDMGKITAKIKGHLCTCLSYTNSILPITREFHNHVHLVLQNLQTVNFNVQLLWVMIVLPKQHLDVGKICSESLHSLSVRLPL